MVGLSLAPFVLRRPWLAKMLTPAANWYANAAGYRKLGLKYDAPSPTARPFSRSRRGSIGKDTAARVEEEEWPNGLNGSWAYEFGTCWT